MTDEPRPTRPLPDFSKVTFIEDDDDLDANPITLPDGTVLDNAAAEKYGRAIADRAWEKRKHVHAPTPTESVEDGPP